MSAGRYKPYPAYRDSGVEWLGEIPVGWGIARISDVDALLNGYPFDSAFFMRGDGTPLVRIRDLNATETEVNYIGPVVESAWIEPGDIIIGMDGKFNVARWRGQRALLNQRMCRLRPRAGVDAGFIANLLPFPLTVINDLTYSTTVKHLSSADVCKIRFGAPPPKEQHAIAAFLDRETARIDDLVAKKERLIELLQEQRTALISRAVTKGLNPNVPMKDSGVEWLGEIPVGWEIRRLSTVCGFQSGKAHEPFVDDAGEYVCVNARFVSTNGKTKKFCIKNFSPARQSDVLMVMSDLPNGRALARTFFVPEDRLYAVNQRVCAISAKACDPRFMFYFLDRNPHFLRYDDGVNQTHLPNAAFAKCPVLLPPMPEQAEIAAFLDAETVKIDALVAKVREAIARLTELRTALISAAVTGKIDVREEVS